MRYAYEVFNEEDIMRIHKTSLRVLENVGMKVYDDSLCSKMSKKGLIVDSDQQLIKFPPEMVNAAVESAPKTITMYDHRSNQEVIKPVTLYLRIMQMQCRYGTGKPKSCGMQR